MGVYLYPNNTETPLKNAYIGIPFPTSIVLDKISINLTTVGDTAQLTATIEPTVSDKTITWSSDDTTIATVSTTGLVTCVTPGECTITATTVNGITATCSVDDSQGWQPGANTLLYLPMNSTDTYLDKSGNNVQTTNDGVTFGEYQGVDCGYFNRNHIQITPFSIPLSTTLLCWCYNTGVYQSSFDGKVFDARNNSNALLTAFVPATSQCLAYVNGTDVTTSSCPQNQWVLIIVTNTDGQQNISVKGNGIDLSADGTIGFSAFTPTYINVGNEWNNGASRYFLGGMSELILEDKIRTAQEKLNYYNQTKANYGL